MKDHLLAQARLLHSRGSAGYPSSSGPHPQNICQRQIEGGRAAECGIDQSLQEQFVAAPVRGGGREVEV
jgi:hypothetical protein